MLSPSDRGRISRRRLLLGAGASAVSASLPGQAPPTHVNVSTLDRGTIVTQAQASLAAPLVPPPARAFYADVAHPEAAPQRFDAKPHLAAFGGMCTHVAALAAGFVSTAEAGYAARATAWLRLWFLNPETRLDTAQVCTGCLDGSSPEAPVEITHLASFAEVARACSFLTDSLSSEELTTLTRWFAELLAWSNGDRQMRIVRDSKDHRASAHLLLSAALARFTRDEKELEDSRKRFRSHTLRDQVRADGVFPQEVATANPYRNTLLNFDLLAGACQLLHSPFDPLWTFELIDGVGLRTVAAYLYPVIAHPEQWRFPADAEGFRQLPGRRPGLLFSGRAFDRPEYVEAWLHASPKIAAGVSESFPIRQPSLWTARAPHGL